MVALHQIRWRIGGILKPYNRQHIRNVPRAWTDRSDRCLHMVFSMLCDFVEDECYDYKTQTQGREGLANRLRWLSDDDGVLGQYENERDILECYDWYTQRDWNEPFGMTLTDDNADDYCRREDEFYDEAKKMLEKAIKTCGGWWT